MEKCDKCGEEGQDRRTLYMSCFYAMSELGLPFKMDNIEGTTRQFFTLRVCKSCRASWMKAIQDWFNKPIQNISTGSRIFVRELGTNKEL